jgi:hypothetical protein
MYQLIYKFNKIYKKIIKSNKKVKYYKFLTINRHSKNKIPKYNKHKSTIYNKLRLTHL